MRGNIVRKRMPTPEEQARLREIIRLLCDGRTDKEIAREVGLAPVTVGWHISHMTALVQGRNRVQLAVWAVKHGYA